MKKFLLLGAAVLVVASASAQAKHVKMTTQNKVAPKMELVKPEQCRTLQTLTATDYNHKVVSPVAKKAPQKESILDVWYTRPAGVYPVGPVIVDGEYAGEYPMTFYMCTPFKDYTFQGYVEGLDVGENLITAWLYNIYEETYMAEGDKLVANYPVWVDDEMPTFFAGVGESIDDVEAREAWFTYQSMYYDFDYDADPPQQTEFAPNEVIALQSFNCYSNIEGYDLFAYQKAFTTGGRFGDNPYTITRVTGLKPADPNAEEGSGNWLGKNAGSVNGTFRVDGIAQAFEKPENPYLLKNVGVELYFVDLSAPVDFKCKIYKLDNIPAYSDEGVVRLPAEPGELIAKGTFTATPEMVKNKDVGYNTLFLNFTLMGFDEDAPDLEYEITPTVDFPILVVLEGYNDEGMEALTNFTTFMSTDWGNDEGFGETAYLMMDDADEEGVFHGDYMFYGLNQFFDFDNIGMCKSAFLISINCEHPFITTYVTNDDEYTFPDEGGQMIRDFEFEEEDGSISELTMDGVYFISSFVSSEGDWFLTWNDEEELPDWLHLELSDLQVGEVYSFVGASASADPLPEGVKYREAKIRFEIPGDYIYYTFKQGGEPTPDDPLTRFDVNHDGEINVADVNALINMILSDTGYHDCNGDGEMNVADINALIDYILNM